MAKRKTTIFAFLKQLAGSPEPTTFLAKHREFLLLGEPAQLIEKEMVLFHQNQLSPAQTLEQVSQIFHQHWINSLVAQAEQDQANKQRLTQEKSTPYQARIVYANGELIYVNNSKGVAIPLKMGFSLPQTAERWAFHRLNEVGSDCYAEIVSGGKLKPITVRISRVEALGALFPKQKMAAHKKLGRRSSKLKWGVKAQNDVFYFSRG